jgi:hypothetical protein
MLCREIQFDLAAPHHIRNYLKMSAMLTRYAAEDGQVPDDYLAVPGQIYISRNGGNPLKPTAL